MPESYPDFPHHTQIAAYFERLRGPLRLPRPDRLRDRRAARRPRAPTAAGRSSSRRASAARYDALLVANGHHWNPRWPEPAFPGAERFAGHPDARSLLHRQLDLRGQAGRGRGDGQLGDGHRRGVLLRGRAHVPVRAQGRLDRAQVRVRQTGRPDAQRPACPVQDPPARDPAAAAHYAGPPERYGLPKPEPPFRRGAPHGLRADPRPHPARDDHPEAQHRLAAMARWCASTTAARWRPTWSCTARATRSPSRSSTRSFISAPDNHIELFRRVFHPQIPNVFFIGLLQPLGAIMPLAEAQGAWVGDYLLGDYALPSRAGAAR